MARFKLDEDDETEVFLKDSQTSLDKKISLIQAELINQSPRHDYLGYLICKNWGLSKYVEGVVQVAPRTKSLKIGKKLPLRRLMN